ncbi:ribonuclease HII [Cohnella sp. AR92]|uniref:ribonuclease HII n=1 Tax=Cohnella sp. AR92 TaxID=648716 RepID=UPI000F8E9855|nr:ribonuclease HII [Cohnella sp. AR92]RUS46390.1 ribonuclease HII [Cohnella sp. AR92]
MIRIRLFEARERKGTSEVVADEGKQSKPKRRKVEVEAEPNRLEFESGLWGQGLTAIAGLDEVGRGCLFGDVVAAAVILPPGLILEGINDSKQLSEKKRELLYDVIIEHAVAWSVARVDAATIDRINIRQASRLAMKQAVEGLRIAPEHLLIDAESVDLELPQTAIIKGDARSQTIGAASILAKVTRDRLCKDTWDALYPGYGLAGNKGYGTKEHREGLLRLGPSPMHRMSFLEGILAEQQVLF